MKTLKLIAIAITAAAISGPAFAGRDQTWNAALERAYSKQAERGLAGPVGLRGKVGPSTSRAAANLGHPTERVRR